jgi:hypothetical protein
VTGAARAVRRHSQRKDYETLGFSRPEHIYWDQASVLAQVGLLEQTGLPVTGVEQVEALAVDAGPELFNTLIVEPGSDVG